MIDNLQKNESRIFICYRNAQVLRAKTLYNWMYEHKSLYFGKVFCSNSDSTANFKFDVDIIKNTEYFIVFLHENFTADFPQTLEEYNEEKIITALEIGALMDRVADKTKPAVKIIGIRIGDLTKKDEENIEKIASMYGTITDNNIIKKRKDSILTSGFNRLLPEDSGAVLSAKFNEFFKDIAVFNDSYYCKIKNKTAEITTLHAILPQTFKKNIKEGNELISTDISVDEIKEALKCPQKPFFIISGNGGMGKTTQLKKLCSEINQENSLGFSQICIYFEARSINENEGKQNPFYSALADAAGLSIEALESNDAQIFFKEKAFEHIKENCIICIDGLDEVNNIFLPESSVSKNVFDSIIELSELGITFILSARSRGLFPHSIIKNAELDIEINKFTFEDIIKQLPDNARPHASSPLAELLKTPFYFSLYAETVTHFDALNELCDADPEIFYYHSSPTVPGELIWNYMMRNIAKHAGKSGQLTENAAQNIFFIMNVLPRIASVIPKGKALKHNSLEAIYIECTEKFKNQKHWQPFWRDKDSTGFIERFINKIPMVDDFIWFSTIAFPVLKTKKDANHVFYGFTHGILNDFFKALNIINEITDIEFMTENELINSPLNSDVLPESIVKLAGEICGERKEAPFYDKERAQWSASNSVSNNLIRRTFNYLREKENISVLVFNLFNILKTARTDGVILPDMSDINFDGIDLSKCSVTNIIFSHTSGESTLKASFKKAHFSSKLSFSEGHTMSGNIKVKALFCPAPHLLLSADNGGTLIMWDTKYAIPTDKFVFAREGTTHAISDMTQDNSGRIWFACDDSLKCITLDTYKKRILSAETHPIKSKYVKHVGLDNKNKVYYHTVDSPFDRRDTDGNVLGAPFGKWVEDAVVSQSGNTAYCIIRDNLSRSLQSVCKYVRLSDGSWNIDKVIVNKQTLTELTSQTFFINGNLYLREDKKTLALYVSGEGRENNSKLKTFKNLIIEFNLETFEISRLSVLRGLKTGAGATSAMCMDSDGTIFIASALDIYSINRNFETRTIGMGKGQLLGTVFTPDTKSFIAVTNNPVRLQFFECSPDRICIANRQIVLTRPRKIHRFALAFQFSEDMTFESSGMKGLSKYPDSLKLILWHRTHGYTIANLFKEKYSKFKEGTTLINTPTASISENEGDIFVIKNKGNTIRRVFINRTENSTEEFTIHPEWLFAGCDFTNVSFSDGEPPEELKRYVILAENGNEPDMESLADSLHDSDDFIDFTDEEE